VGKWKSPPQVFYGPRGRLLLEDFLNWPSDDRSILKFIRKYGPLMEKPAREDNFGFDLYLWPNWKKTARIQWEDLMEDPHHFEFQSCVDDALLSYVNGRFEFRADCLDTFLILELASCERRRLRKCAAPDCDTPYFVARHLRQKYCSDKCALWAQKIWKKNWWEEHGKEWRREHAKKR